MMVHTLPRAVQIPNNYNTRHLGGLPTRHGNRSTSTALIRSGMPCGFTAKDLDILCNSYNLSRILDLRKKEEISENPQPPLPTQVAITHVPVFQETEVNKNKEQRASPPNAALGGQAQVDLLSLAQAFVALGQTEEGVVSGFLETYGTLVLVEHSHSALRLFFNILLAEASTVLFHCAGGKDRTGFFSYLLLQLLGVSEDECMDDFLLTNSYFEVIYHSKLEELYKFQDERIVDGIRLLLGVKAEYMEHATKLIKEQYGSIEGYLSATAKLTEQECILLQEKYTYFPKNPTRTVRP